MCYVMDSHQQNNLILSQIWKPLNFCSEEFVPNFHLYSPQSYYAYYDIHDGAAISRNI